MEAGEIEKVTMPTYVWRVHINFFKGKKVGDFILSPIFSFDLLNNSRENWQLTLYPKGDTAKSKGDSTLYLHCFSKEKIHTIYTLSLLDKYDDIEIFFKDESDFHLKQELNGCAFKNETFVRDPKKNILKDDHVSFQCCVMMIEKTVKNEATVHNEKALFRIDHFDKLKKLLASNEYSDVTILADGRKFFLHKNILSNYSEVFKAIFDKCSQENKKVELEGVRYEVLQKVFRFIYTGDVNNIEETAKDLFDVANKYCIEGLKALCLESMSKNLNKDNAIEYFKFSMIKNDEKLKTNAIEYMARHLDTLMKDQELEKLYKDYPSEMYQITNKFFSVK